MINIVIVDDDVLALTKLKSLINLKNTKVSGEYTQPEDALSHIRKHRTDILLTDMRMPKIDGIELIRQAREKMCIRDSCIPPWRAIWEL